MKFYVCFYENEHRKTRKTKTTKILFVGIFTCRHTDGMSHSKAYAIEIMKNDNFASFSLLLSNAIVIDYRLRVVFHALMEIFQNHFILIELRYSK